MANATVKTRHRKIRKITGSDVAKHLDPLVDGEAIFALTDGVFSSAEILAWALGRYPGARVWISTWSVGLSEAHFLGDIMRSRKVSELRVVVDRSWPTRHEAFCAELVKQVGPESVYIARSHAKIVALRNDTGGCLIRGSLNFNPNPRCEQVDIDLSAELADWTISHLSSIASPLGASTPDVDAKMAEWRGIDAPAAPRSKFGEVRKPWH